MAEKKTNDYKPVNGKLCDHFGFKVDDNNKVVDGEKVYCIHCDKVLAFCGSNTSMTYHLQHTHPTKYNTLLSKTVGGQTGNSKQTSLSQFVLRHDKPVSTKLQTDITNSIAHWIVSGGRPVSIIKDSGLQQVLRVGLQNDEYKLPTRQTIDSIIDRMFQEKSLKLKMQVSRASAIAITSDFWTSLGNESYCGVTAHWIDSDWSLQSVTLDCIGVMERHFAENVAEIYTNLAVEWHFSTDKLQAIVTDSACNMVAAVGKTPFHHIPCIAHCLQLSVLHGLKIANTETIFSICRKLVGHFKHSAANTHELQVCHDQAGNQEPLRKLQQDIPTRWNSTYLMLVRLLEAKNDITSYFKHHPRNYSGPKLTENDWEKMEKYWFWR